jgi:hypothetical protein
VRNHGQTTLGRPFAGLVFTLLIALTPAACTKSPGPASPAYEQAHQRFSKLYGQKLDEAFLDPAMEEIEAQLQQVPPDSMDAQPARELLQRIREGRERMEAAQKEKEDAIASAHRVDDFPARQGEPGTPSTPPEEPPTPSAGPPDAGTPRPGAGPVAGTPASELPYGYERCFRRGESVNVDGKGSREMWELESRLACRQSYPSFAEQVVLIEDGRVLTVLPKSAIRVTFVGPDGGPPSGR